MDMQTDLVVVGGGLAGFCAALQAAQDGYEVILLEKQSETGGSSVLSGGCLAFAGTDMQREAGIDDSPELLFNDLREVGKYENDESLVRCYVANQLDTYAFLKQAGAVATGKVTVLMQTAAQRLVVEPADSCVVGLTATGEAGEFIIRGRAGVLLASGGFCRNAELVHCYAPQYDNAIFIGGEGNVGDGLRMAQKLGADTRDMAYIKGTFGQHPTDETNHHSCQCVYKGAIAVNQDGKRFVNESISYKLLGDACIVQPYASAFQILDHRILKSGDNSVRILDFERRLEEGLMIEAQSLEELAALIEVPADTLIATVDQYNGYVDAGHDPDFGRRHLVHEHGALVRIDQAPFYAYPSTAAVFGTYCGLRVDDKLRVIDVFGDALPGLYAAGEVVGGLHGAAYMTGSSLGKAAIFGRVAARSALATLK